ncbi:WSC domain-containing protein [Aspergillus novofumigatus IBT 16806]|uniref:WSC domain-containing protein n=1 Tax=Aspergillus novofumigatus (strain IBT 16806) TaxID=1392255 RepID=A0A2I1CI01_ASPN1|nr:uncharacterized protein P174DRAFT_448912 [Aspergillus novofumigatus IBT 16806]PKX97259.1 hypothetical protein P174DRAFT_448912 [Aspergillus novofumigatus IBT 16806]
MMELQPVYCVCGIDTTLRWRSLGCYSDDTNHRTLNTTIVVSGNTVQTCEAACAQASFTYAGMEFGTQCFCGTVIMNNAASVPASQRDIACPADGS